MRNLWFWKFHFYRYVFYDKFSIHESAQCRFCFFFFFFYVIYNVSTGERGEGIYRYFFFFFFFVYMEDLTQSGRKYIHYAIRQIVKLAYSARYILRTRDNFIAIENLYSLCKIWKLIVYSTGSFHERVASRVKTNYRLNSYPILYPSPWAS